MSTGVVRTAWTTTSNAAEARLGLDVPSVEEMVTALGAISLTWDALSGKPETFPPSSHTHAYSSLSDIPSTFTPAAHVHTYSSLSGIPSTFAPSSHTQAWSTITDTPSTYPPSSHTHVYSALSDIPSTFAPAAHNQAWSTITDAPNFAELYNAGDEGNPDWRLQNYIAWDWLTDKPSLAELILTNIAVEGAPVYEYYLNNPIDWSFIRNPPNLVTKVWNDAINDGEWQLASDTYVPWSQLTDVPSTLVYTINTNIDNTGGEPVFADVVSGTVMWESLVRVPYGTVIPALSEVEVSNGENPPTTWQEYWLQNPIDWSYLRNIPNNIDKLYLEQVQAGWLDIEETIPYYDYWVTNPVGWGNLRDIPNLAYVTIDGFLQNYIDWGLVANKPSLVTNNLAIAYAIALS